MDNEILKDELTGLLRYITRVRSEIAAITNPVDEQHHFNSMGDQLDAIVKATETATNRIMQAVEKNDDVIEACSFQDITGQRVNKVVKSITYVEERVNSLVELWGKEELDKVVVEVDTRTEDEKLLEGPQLEGKGLSQAEVDALFD
ncbi:MAG: protein phosphatase CheZ [Rhodospirillaceae bacterium]